MNIKKILITSVASIFLVAHGMEQSCKKGVVIVPVADATAEFLPFSGAQVKEMYDQFGYSPQEGKLACARVHQLLFNEPVVVDAENDGQVRCAICNAFYANGQSHFNKFWTLKSNILPLSEVATESLPRPYAKNFKLLPTDNILVLIKPWFNTRDRKWYSVGTRFRRCPTSDRDNVYVVAMVNGTQGSEIGLIPKELALVDIPQDIDGRLRLFVSILRDLARSKKHIPYVWGGCSCIKHFEQDDFSCTYKNTQPDPVTHWVRPGSDSPCSGFDCSGLVLRIAQIAHMPYFFKNTMTLKEHLKKLDEEDVLEEGDLIWMPRHVMIVSDLMHNKVIEAVGYAAGYGKVHEISLDKIFDGIANYSDLLNAYFKKLPLHWHDAKGQIKTVYPEFLILKMKSIWNQTIEQQ